MKNVIQIRNLAVLSAIFWTGSMQASSVLPSSKATETWMQSPNGQGRASKGEMAAISSNVAAEPEKAPREELALSETEKTKEQIDTKKNRVILQNTKGIVLVGNEEGLTQIDFKGFDGIYLYDLNLPGNPERLEKRLEKFLDKPLTLGDIIAIKKTIIDFYRDNGRPMVVIQVPEQEITDGVIQFVLTEGTLDKVVSKGNKYFKSRTLEKYIQLKPGEPVNERRLVRNLNFINKNPFRRTNAVYTPGDKPGTTEIDLVTKERFPLRGYIGVDNTGMERTGETRWFAGFNWGNAFFADQQLSYQYTTSTDFHKFQAHTANYTIPLPWEHMLTFYGGYSSIHAKLPRPAKHSHGNAYQASMRYDIPLNPIQKYIHEFIWGGDFKRTNNTLEFEEKPLIIGPNVNLTQFAFLYNGGLELQRCKTFVEAEAYYSPGKWVADQSQSVYRELRPGAKPTYAYFRGSLVYTQYFPKNFSVSGLFRGQVATSSLLPSEQFGLGGYNTVRGYEERQVNTDNAVLLSAEARSPMIGILQYFGNRQIKDGIQFLAFIDYGYGQDYKKIPKIPKDQWLLGVGPGLRYNIDPYLSVRLDYGFKCHKHHFQGSDIGRLHFAVIGSY